MTDKWLLLKASGGGGLGDSIKSLLVATLYAKLSGRILIVDWRGGIYSDGAYNPFPQLFSVEGVAYSEQIPDTSDVYPEVWRGALSESLHEVYTRDQWASWDRARTIATYSFDLGKLDYQQSVLVMWEFDQIDKLIGKFAGVEANAMAHFQYAFSRFVAVMPTIAEAVDRAAIDFVNPMLGIHVRATDEFQQNKGGVLLEDYLRAVDKARHIENINGLFLSTDNQSVQESFLQRYPSVVVTQKWFAEPGKSLHLNNQCPDKFEGLKSAIQDILLLAKCDYLVLNQVSSFSELAIIISGRTPDKIYYPRKTTLTSIKHAIKRALNGKR